MWGLPLWYHLWLLFALASRWRSGAWLFTNDQRGWRSRTNGIIRRDHWVCNSVMLDCWQNLIGARSLYCTWADNVVTKWSRSRWEWGLCRSEIASVIYIMDMTCVREILKEIDNGCWHALVHVCRSWTDHQSGDECEAARKQKRRTWIQRKRVVIWRREKGADGEWVCVGC